MVGAGRTAERFVKAFGSNFDIIGFIEDDASKPLLQAYPRLGGFADVEQVLRRHPVYDVVLAIPGLSKGEIVNLFYRVQPFVKQVSLIPDLFGIPVGNLKVLRSFDDQLLVLQTRNNLNRLSNRLLKRLFDLIVGSMIAVVIMPILFAVYVMIKLDSDGPAFYNAERIGKNGKLFRCYKFRSMYVDADRILLDFWISIRRQKRNGGRFRNCGARIRASQKSGGLSANTAWMNCRRSLMCCRAI